MARALHRLTTKAVTNAKAAGYYADGDGLYLQVSASGSKSWVFRYMFNRKSHEMGLGSARIVSLAEAREKTMLQRKLLSDGIDPLEAREMVRRKRIMELAKDKTFDDCAQAYIAAHRHEWKSAKHTQQWSATIATYCKPILNIPVQVVDTAQVVRVLTPIWNGNRETAVRLRARIERVLDSAKTLGYTEGENPAKWRGHLEHLLAKDNRRRRTKHHAALPYTQIAAFVRELGKEDGVAARALDFTILTAARTGEVISATWQEIDLKAALWVIPGERMKSGREHRVPLSPRAMEILESLPRMGEYVFPGRDKNKPLSNMAMLQLLQRMGRSELTVHGFRSTFRDWAAEQTSFPQYVVEMALAHAVADSTEAAYRRGDLFQKRVVLMDEWARCCDTRHSTLSIESRRASISPISDSAARGHASSAKT